VIFRSVVAFTKASIAKEPKLYAWRSKMLVSIKMTEGIDIKII